VFNSYQKESLVSVFEEGQILEFNEPNWDVILIDEETSEQHEWNNEYWGQCHGELLI
jgi:hypothetical protein